MPRVAMSRLLSSSRPRVIASDRSSRGVLSARTARRSEATMRIGFIGLGNMGGPMAQNLMKAGHALVVHDTRSEMVKPHLERGAKGRLDRVKPVLEAMGDKVGYMGEIGCGTIAKLVHNMIGICTRQIVAEAFTLGVKAGVRPEALLAAVKGGAFGQGLLLTQVLPEIVFKGDFDTVRFALRLARKDLGLATELAREYNVPMEMAALAEQTLIEALARGWGDKDFSAPFMLQEERAGVKVRT